MATTILTDALADARVLRETALANAKIALEETFQPTLQRLVSSKIQEEDEDEEQGIDIDINYGGEEEDDSVGFDSFGGDEEGGEDFEDGEYEDEEPVEEEDDLEMESLIRELEDGELEEELDDDMFAEEDDLEEGDDDYLGEGDEYLDEEDDELSEAFEDDELDEEYDDLEEGDDEEEVMAELHRIFEEEGLGDDLDLGPNDDDGGVYSLDPPSGPQFVENRRLRNENRKLRRERNNALKAVTTLKKAVNEVNLLNAKLMFTTKTLRTNDLTESQKERILNSFDRASSVREVKLVYTAIVESLNRKPKKSRKLSEGFASTSVKQINPNKQFLNESNNIVNFSRLQELAGIKQIKF